MHIVWWILTIVCIVMGILGLTGTINPNFYNKQKKEDEQPLTRDMAIKVLSFGIVGFIVFYSLATGFFTF